MQSRRLIVWSTIYCIVVYCRSKLYFAYIAHVKTFKCYLKFHIEPFQDNLGHLPFSLLQQNKPMLSPTSRRTSRLYRVELPARHYNLVSKPLHFSASSTPQRLSKPTPISGGWRLIPSFCQTSRFLNL